MLRKNSLDDLLKIAVLFQSTGKRSIRAGLLLVISGGFGEFLEIVPCQPVYIHLPFCCTKTAVYKNSTAIASFTNACILPVINSGFAVHPYFLIKHFISK